MYSNFSAISVSSLNLDRLVSDQARPATVGTTACNPVGALSFFFRGSHASKPPRRIAHSSGVFHFYLSPASPPL
eukprot:4209140-Prymnesium_polylepis.1